MPETDKQWLACVSALFPCIACERACAVTDLGRRWRATLCAEALPELHDVVGLRNLRLNVLDDTTDVLLAAGSGPVTRRASNGRVVPREKTDNKKETVLLSSMSHGAASASRFVSQKNNVNCVLRAGVGAAATSIVWDSLVSSLRSCFSSSLWVEIGGGGGGECGM